MHEMINDEDFINAEDSAGNTILHLAVAGKQLEIIKYLLEKEKIMVDTKNARGLTARDILHSPKIQKDEITTKIMEELQKANAKSAKSLERGEWVKRNGDPLMVVASLIATIAFQVGASPPGGFWQDDKDHHVAGEAIMAYNYPVPYLWLVKFSTIGFVASLTTIVLLHSGLHIRKKAFMWILVVVMWLAISSTAACFMVAVVYISPIKYFNRKEWANTILLAVLVFCSVMAILIIIHTVHLIGVIRRYQIIYYAEKLVKLFDNKMSQSSTEGQLSERPTPGSESHANV
ncbi:hypothetical protein NMG60_11025813 [Bertholletia excelsa]